MRIFNNGYELIREVERDVAEMGIHVHPTSMQDKQVGDNPDYDTLEVQGYGYTLTKLDKLEEMVEYMNGNIAWCKAELKDRVAPEYINPGEAWKQAPNLWAQFIRDGQFAYTYNNRFREQLSQLIRELQIRPNTRQAVMTMYDKNTDMGNRGGKDRVPCSMYYQFFIRGGQLNLVYTMRSCDLLTHLAHDIYLASGLLCHVASELGIKPGHLTHFIGSLHAYQKDIASRKVF